MPNWPHSPLHYTIEPGTYMVTAGTYGKERHFSSQDRLDFFTARLFKYAQQYDWNLQAWAVMSNHYHFIAYSPDPSNMRSFISLLHSVTAKYINQQDGKPGRKIWYQYWDSHISFESSYLARLNYVHNNPVHHGLVQTAENYDWCSANWFAMNAKSSFRRTVESFKTDRLNVNDDF